MAFLGETVAALRIVGVTLVAAGVFLASGVLGKPRPTPIS
jgi:drug/metabolite transporter (DMT)-like permease